MCTHTLAPTDSAGLLGEDKAFISRKAVLLIDCGVAVGCLDWNPGLTTA